MANTTQSLSDLVSIASARTGASRGVAIILGEGVISEVGAVEPDPKGVLKCVVVIAMLGGTREPQVLKCKLTAELTKLAHGLEPYTRVRFLGTYRLWNINGKTYPTVQLMELQTVGGARAESVA